MKFTKATWIFLASGVVFLGGGGLAASLFNGITEKTATLAALQKEATSADQLSRELEAQKLVAVENGTKLAHLEKGIPEVAYVPTMLKELEAFGKQHGVQVFGVRPFVAATTSKKSDSSKERKREKPYSELSIEIKGKGKYRAAMDFVKAMTNFPKIVAVRTVGLSPKASTTSEGAGYANLDITIELRAYLFKPQKGESLGFPVETPKTDEPEEKPKGSGGIVNGKPVQSAHNQGSKHHEG